MYRPCLRLQLALQTTSPFPVLSSCQWDEFLESRYFLLFLTSLFKYVTFSIRNSKIIQANENYDERLKYEPIVGKRQFKTVISLSYEKRELKGKNKIVEGYESETWASKIPWLGTFVCIIYMLTVIIDIVTMFHLLSSTAYIRCWSNRIAFNEFWTELFI